MMKRAYEYVPIVLFFVLRRAIGKTRNYNSYFNRKHHQAQVVEVEVVYQKISNK